MFCHLANDHLEELNRWTEDAPIIQIGGGGFNGFSQTDFLTRYERNWEQEEKEKKKEKKRSILIKKRLIFVVITVLTTVIQGHSS